MWYNDYNKDTNPHRLIQAFSEISWDTLDTFDCKGQKTTRLITVISIWYDMMTDMVSAVFHHHEK